MKVHRDRLIVVLRRVLDLVVMRASTGLALNAGGGRLFCHSQHAKALFSFPVEKMHPITAVASTNERKQQRHGMHPLFFKEKHERHVNAGHVSGIFGRKFREFWCLLWSPLLFPLLKESNEALLGGCRLRPKGDEPRNDPLVALVHVLPGQVRPKWLQGGAPQL